MCNALFRAIFIIREKFTLNDVIITYMIGIHRLST